MNRKPKLEKILTIFFGPGQITENNGQKDLKY